MLSFSNLLIKKNFSSLNDLDQRQYRMILYVSFELICLSSIIFSVYVFAKIEYMIILIGISFILAAFNLALLVSTKNINLCGHIATSLILVTVIFANFIVGGSATPYSIWFYLIPLLAVALIGWRSLFVYSVLSLIMILIFGSLHFQPVYPLSTHQKLIIEWANHLVAYFILVTTLYSLMHENSLYEKILSDQNYLLQADKEKFQHLARHDQLTGLPNRQYFFHYLQEAITTVPENYYLTLFYMDLDNLKKVNDVYGHNAGDYLLRKTAKRLRVCFREGDFIARLGGDEFTAIVIHPKNAAIPKEIAHRIIQEFNKPMTFENAQYGSSISVGLTSFPNDAKNILELVKKADTAMYASKKNRASNIE